MRLDALTHVAKRRKERLVLRAELRFDPLAQTPRKTRRSAPRRDGNHKRAARHLRRHQKIAQRGPVHDVDERPRRTRIGRHPRIDPLVVGRRNDDGCAGEVFRGLRRRHAFQALIVGERGQQLRCDDADPRARIGQGLGLAEGHLATADDHGAAAGEVQHNRIREVRFGHGGQYTGRRGRPQSNSRARGASAAANACGAMRLSLDCRVYSARGSVCVIFSAT